jgi:hypothetical protein
MRSSQPEAALSMPRVSYGSKETWVFRDSQSWHDLGSLRVGTVQRVVDAVCDAVTRSAGRETCDSCLLRVMR